MEMKSWFMLSSWITILVGIWVIFGAFDPYIIYSGDFYVYLILISGIIGIIGALISLGIFPIIGGLSISISIIYLTFQYSFNTALLITFLKAVLLIIGGCGIILTFEEPIDLQSFELPRLGMGKGEFLALKDLGITTLEELIAEKGNEEEICSITIISLTQLKNWIKKAEEIIQEHKKVKKDQLRKSLKKI